MKYQQDTYLHPWLGYCSGNLDEISVDNPTISAIVAIMQFWFSECQVFIAAQTSELSRLCNVNHEMNDANYLFTPVLRHYYYGRINRSRKIILALSAYRFI